jgi:hypothetical protein
VAPPGLVRYPGGIGQRFTDLNVSLGSAALRAALLLSTLLFAATTEKVKAPKAGKENARGRAFSGEKLSISPTSWASVSSCPCSRTFCTSSLSLRRSPAGNGLPPLLVALYHPRRATARVYS